MNDRDKAVLTHFLFPDQAATSLPNHVLYNAASGDRLCRLQYADDTCTRDVCLHIHQGQIRLYCLRAPDAPGWRLSNPAQVREACSLVLNRPEEKGTEYDNPPSPAMLMTLQDFDDIRDHINRISLPNLCAQMVHITGDERQGPILAKLLKNGAVKSELRLCTCGSGGRHQHHYAVYIGGTGGGFLLRMPSQSSEEWVAAVPFTKALLNRGLIDWISGESPF